MELSYGDIAHIQQLSKTRLRECWHDEKAADDELHEMGYCVDFDTKEEKEFLDDFMDACGLELESVEASENELSEGDRHNT
ncbi:MAG: hypothetical protein WC455_10485 [Dehalococcoidia bacterium]|jgi:hypothetical protein